MPMVITSEKGGLVLIVEFISFQDSFVLFKKILRVLNGNITVNTIVLL